MTTPHATVAVISIGQMGLGIATLLLAHNFRVITNVSDRSTATQERARSAGVEMLSSDEDLVRQADFILSIVPPIDAPTTAQRILSAIANGARTAEKEPLWFLDLNAGSPASAESLNTRFHTLAPAVRFLDGGIIGAPPRLADSTWLRPGIPLSGPHKLGSAPAGARLADVLNTRHIDDTIGSASGLKACFAALTKGFTALAVQSYTTAAKLQVLPELEHYLDAYNPGARERAERGILGCTTKAYRWVEEMRLIGATFDEAGGFGEGARVFGQVAGVYEGMAGFVGERGVAELRSAGEVAHSLGSYLHTRRRSV